MSYGRFCAFWTLAVFTVLTLPAVGQSVISTRSGIVYFLEGNVYLDDQLLDSNPGKFPRLRQGALLRTAEAHAEVLLTPGVFVRTLDSLGSRTTQPSCGEILPPPAVAAGPCEAKDVASLTAMS